MTTLAPPSNVLVAPRISVVQISEEALVLELADGRTVSAPLAWYPRLSAGSVVEREHLELLGEGEGIHWPDLDEDLSVESVLAGRPSAESLESFRRWLSARVSSGAVV